MSYDIKQCSVCKELKKRKKVGKTSSGPIWVDELEPYRDWETDRKSTRLNSSHITRSRMPSSA